MRSRGQVFKTLSSSRGRSNDQFQTSRSDWRGRSLNHGESKMASYPRIQNAASVTVMNPANKPYWSGPSRPTFYLHDGFL